ncbi:MAG: PASTA domain-containing protein [Bacilli bacterium]|nr:PASTA domain-containing protein [Clostridia bacterium]MBR6820741.1 PASTA domain-containing protein [Bacilli bacterium]
METQTIENNKKKRNIIIIVSVIVGLLVLTGIGFGIKAYVDLQKEQEELKEELDEIKEEKEEKEEETELEDIESNLVVIPEVKGKTVSKVVSELQELGFEVADETETISDPTVPVGRVVKTNPPSGSKREHGTEVTIFISSGVEKIKIENYVGKNVLEVRGILETYGINVFVEYKEIADSSKYEENEVIEQSVKAGTMLNSGDSITLYAPKVVNKYPDFTDGTWTEEDVKDFCYEYGVMLVVERETNSSYDNGTIIKQSRPKGYAVKAGTTLTITVIDNNNRNSSSSNPLEG